MRKYEVRINGKPYTIAVKEYTSEHAVLEINEKPYTVAISGMITGVVDSASRFVGSPDSPAAEAETAARPATVPKPTPSLPNETAAAAERAVGSDRIVRAPIPGSILIVKVKEGEEVQKGQLLLKMEAMKMENEIAANCSGKVVAVNVRAGDSVNQGEVLIELG